MVDPIIKKGSQHVSTILLLVQDFFHPPYDNMSYSCHIILYLHLMGSSHPFANLFVFYPICMFFFVNLVYGFHTYIYMYNYIYIYCEPSNIWFP